MYTQCPECLTYFQVTPEHLKIAQGNVRCGQCRNVFSALGNLTEEPPASAYQAPSKSIEEDLDDFIVEEEDLEKTTKQKKVSPPAAKKKAVKRSTSTTAKTVKTKTPKSPAVKSAFKQKAAPKVEVPEEVVKEPKTENKSRLGQAIAAIKALNTSSSKLTSLEDGRDGYIEKIKTNFTKLETNIKEVKKRVVTPSDKATKNKAAAAKPVKKPKPEAAPREIKAKPVKKKTVTPVKKAPQPRKKILKPPVDHTESGVGLDSANTGHSQTNSDINLDQTFQAIDELDNNSGIGNFDFSSTEIEIEPPPNTHITEMRAENPAQQNDENVDIKVKPLARKAPPKAVTTAMTTQNQTVALDSTQGKSLAIIPKQLIDDFRGQIATTTPAASPISTLWSIGSVVLMLLFLLQTIYFKHNDLAKNPQLRPWMESFCRHLPCDLTLPSDIKNLELLGQDIRSHPKEKNALLVSTTIINNARYNQSYPILEITFSNINGGKVAMRRFRANEYLSSAKDIEAGMPPNTPVQIELEIMDPGAKAVNFEFDFIPAS